MYESIRVATKDVAEIAKRFGYRKKTATIVVTEAVTLSDLNWSGGTRSQYAAVDLETLGVAGKDLSMRPPWDNPAEGMRVEIPDNVAIVRTGTFCGKPGIMTIYVNPLTYEVRKQIGAPA